MKSSLRRNDNQQNVEKITESSYQICTRCVMDSSVSDIFFDHEGECKYCKIHDELEKVYPLGTPETAEIVTKLIEKVKQSGKGKSYDVVCGVSGGRDSTWALYKTVSLGLRPLAVHFDNGWNSEIAVSNIKNATKALNVDLETVVADWDEFRDLQVSFLKASVPEVEIPTDVAIHSVMHKVAANEGIKYIFNGHAFRTEGLAPISWCYMDGRYISSIQKQFSKIKLKDFNNFSAWDLFYYSFIKGIKVVPILNYFPYDPEEVHQILESKLGWKYYGGHHYENVYTKFTHQYLLPKKFSIDRRKKDLSAAIRDNKQTRAAALQELETDPVHFDSELIKYALAKLEVSESEWKLIEADTPKSFLDYPSYYPLIKALKGPLTVAYRLKLISELLYLKFVY